MIFRDIKGINLGDLVRLTIGNPPKYDENFRTVGFVTGLNFENISLRDTNPATQLPGQAYREIKQDKIHNLDDIRSYEVLPETVSKE